MYFFAAGCERGAEPVGRGAAARVSRVAGTRRVRVTRSCGAPKILKSLLTARRLKPVSSSAWAPSPRVPSPTRSAGVKRSAWCVKSEMSLLSPPERKNNRLRCPCSRARSSAAARRRPRRCWWGASCAAWAWAWPAASFPCTSARSHPSPRAARGARVDSRLLRSHGAVSSSPGALGSANQLCICVGILAAILAGIPLANDPKLWRSSAQCS